jgi:hypothetical protein
MRCDNCAYYKLYDKQHAFCSHVKHNGVLVPGFTSCPEYEPKNPGPFNGIKLFLKDATTGEIELKYVCEDCNRVMNAPFSWQFKLPARLPGEATLNTCGFHFRCEDCSNKRDMR